MTAMRPLPTAIALVLIAVALFGWTVEEARRQRAALESALTREASLLASSLGPGLEAASNASREVEELVFWKLLDNARLIAALNASGTLSRSDLEQLMESNGLDSVAVIDPAGRFSVYGEEIDPALLGELEPLLDGSADDLILGSTLEHTTQHLAAATRSKEGGAVLVRVEWSTAQTFARRIGVESLLSDLIGTGVVLYLSYVEEPGSIVVEGAWNGGPVPPPQEGGGLRHVYDRPIFEVGVPLEAPADSQVRLRVGLDGAPLIAVARRAMIRNLVIGLVLTAFAVAGTALAVVSTRRSREQIEAARTIAESEAARRRSERLAAAGALTAGLAHEVRSPLNAIHLAAQRLVRKLPEGDDRRDIAARIGSEVQRLEGVLREFLELASPVGEHRERIDLAALVREVLDLLEMEAEENGVGFAPVHGTGSVDVDRESMRRALINLVRNAIQASPVGGTVTVSLTATNQQVEVRITDEGPGVAPEVASQVFDPFVTSRPSGTGLGLALVQRVVEEYHGSVRLSDGPDGGAEAVICLPAGEETRL